MGFYFIIFGLLALPAFVESFGLNKRVAKSIFIFYSIVFFALSFLRWETGTDWDSYYEYFNSINNWFENTEFEPAYALVNEFAKLQFDSFTVTLFICGLILFVFQSAAIIHMSPLPILSLLFLWSTQAANVFFVRQWVACAILFYSIKYIVTRKLIPFLLLVALAMMFHRTSIIFVFGWWVYKVKLKPQTMFVVLLLSIGFSSLSAMVMERLGTLIGGIVQSKLEAYLGDSAETFGQTTPLVITIAKGFINKLIIIITAFIMLRKIEARTPEFRGYLNLYWFGCILYFMTISISLALTRLSYPFDLLQIILLPYIFVNLPNNQLKIVVFFVTFFYFALRLASFLLGSYYDSYVPFKTIIGY